MHALITTGVAVTAGIVAFLAARELRPSDRVRVKPQLTSVTSTTGAEAVIALTNFLLEATPEERRMLDAHFAANPLAAPFNEAVAILMPRPKSVLDAATKTAVSLTPHLGIAETMDREKAILKFLKTLDVTDPAALEQAAMAYVEIAGTVRRSRAFYELAKRIIAHDPEVARRWAARLPPGNVRDVATGLAVVALSDNDPDALFRYLDGIGWKTDFRVAYTAEKFRMPSPREKLQWSYSSGSRSKTFLNEAINKAIIQMVDGDDPVEAFRQAAKISNPETYQGATSAAFDHWFQKDPKAAIAFLDDLGASGASTRMARDAIIRIGWIDPGLAASYFASLTDFGARKTVGNVVARALVKKSPDLALDWWSQLPETERAAFLSPIESELVDEHPLVAAEFITEYPGLITRPYSYEKIVRSLSRIDVGSASEWVATLPEGDKRDSSVGALVRHLSRAGKDRDMASATQWAESITGPESREKSLELIKNYAPGTP